MLNDMILKITKAVRALATRKIIIECDRIPYEFTNVPFKKIINWLLLEVSIFVKPDRPWGMPTHIMMEPTAHCNLRCVLCPVTEGMDRPKGHMDLDLFKKIIDETGDYLLFVLLWDWGEPFLNPSIHDMIAYAKGKGIKAVSCTNGHPFAMDENAEKVVRSGLDTLVVAMDGTTQETYERYRQGGDLESVLKGVRNIVAWKSTLNSKKPFINLRSIVMKHNEQEIIKIKDMARSLGVDALTFIKLNPYIRDIYSESRAANKKEENGFLPEDSHYKRFKTTEDGNTRIRLKQNPCKHLWNNPAIHWDGTVCPCTYDYNEKFGLGDLKRDTFKNIWFGAPYRKIRRHFRTNWRELNICSECSYGYEGGDLAKNAISDAFFFKTTND